MHAQLGAISRNAYVGILVLMAVSIISALAVYVTLPQFRAWRSASTSYAVMQSALSHDGYLQGQLQSLPLEIAELEKRLNGEGVHLPFRQVESHVIGQLQRIAWKNNIELAGVTPRLGKKVDRYREVLFDVSMVGEYFDIYRLLTDFEQSLGLVVINEFDVATANVLDRPAALQVKMTIASYRIEQS